MSAPHPSFFQIPALRGLDEFEIWDSYFTPSHSSPGPDGQRLLDEISATLPLAKAAGFRRLCLFPHVGSDTADARTKARLRATPEEVLKPFVRHPELLGMIQLNAADPRGSLDLINRWIQDGPMVGVYFPAGRREEQVCSHANFDRLVERIAELDGAIMQHTWFTTGGKLRPGQSTPAELATLAARHPGIRFICAHAGGEWERGLRAVRERPNVLVETSGFDATAGFVEMAVRELGARRIVFGSHLPSRSLATELTKVTAARITRAEKFRILGANFRELLAPRLRRR